MSAQIDTLKSQSERKNLGRPSHIDSVFADIFISLKRHRLWLWMGMRDLVIEHARSFLGITWPLIGALAWIGIVYLFLGQSLSQDNPTYLAYLTIGIVLYNYASGILSGGVMCFRRYHSLILNIPNPLFIYPLRQTLKVVAGVMVQVPFIFVTLYVCDVSPTLQWLWVLPAILAYLITGAFLSLSSGMVGVWVGDMQFLMTSVMRMVMFVTPIFWYSAESGARYYGSLFNPLSHYIAIIRDPLLNQPVPQLSWMIVIGCTLASVVVGLMFFHRSRNRLVRRF